MKIVTLAAGFAAGYLLGTRAGREKFEQIAAAARRVSNHPTVVQAQEKARDAVHTKLETAGAGTVPARRKPVPASPPLVGQDPLV